MYHKGKGRASVHLLWPRAVWGCCLCCTSPGKGKRESDPAMWFMHLVAALLHVIASRSPALCKKHEFRDFFFILHPFAPHLYNCHKLVTEKESRGMPPGCPSPSPGPLAGSVSHAPFPIPPLPRCWTCGRMGAVWLGCCTRDCAELYSTQGPLDIDQDRQ